MTIVINDSTDAELSELCDIVRPRSDSCPFVSSPCSPSPSRPPGTKELSDTQNWPKEKRVKKGCDWKENECVCGRRGTAEAGRRERESEPRRRDKEAEECGGEMAPLRLPLSLALSLSLAGKDAHSAGRKTRGSERRVSKMSWQWGVGYIVPRATATDITGTDGGWSCRRETRAMKVNYTWRRTQSFLSLSLSLRPSPSRARASSHDPFLPLAALSRKPPLRHPPTARTNADTRIPPDAHCRSACRSSFASPASVFDFPGKIRDREKRHWRTWLTSPVAVNGSHLYLHSTPRFSSKHPESHSVSSKVYRWWR